MRVHLTRPGSLAKSHTCFLQGHTDRCHTATARENTRVNLKHDSMTRQERLVL